MKNKLSWLLLSCILVAALLLVGCSISEDETTTIPETTVQEPALPEDEDETSVLPETTVPEPASPEDEDETTVPPETVVEEPVNEAQVVFEFSEVDSQQRAVAFHSISYLDADGYVIDELTFGTPEVSAFLDEGWSEPEEADNIGTYQWTGGVSQRASMRLPVPDGTEGLLLNMMSSVHGTLMDVTFQGELNTRLRLNDYWHSGYVPIVEYVQVYTPVNEPQWQDGHYFPYFPETDRIYVIRVRKYHTVDDYYASELGDWRISDSYERMMSLTLVGMQGIINRNCPRVYLELDQYYTYWVPYLEDEVEVIHLNMDGLSAFNFLYRRYSSYFSGAVVYDPEVPDTINLATMIAGLENKIMLSPEQLDMPGIPSFNSVTNLNELVEEKGWDDSEESKYELYEWVYDNLWPHLEHRIIGVINPGPPTSLKFPDTENKYIRLGTGPRDYIVALRLTALWLSAGEEPQASLFARFLEDARSPNGDPNPTPVFGFYGFDEEGTVALASRHGDWVPAITNGVGTDPTGGLTVLSGIRPDIEKYQPELDTDRILATLGDKPVAALFNSDGDSIQYCMQRGFNSLKNFIWEEIQGHRFGWELNPVLVDIAPIIWNHYVASRNEVCLMSGLSGAGYMYPQLMNDAQLEDYLSYAATYMNETGLSVIHTSSRFGPWEDIADLYYEGLPPLDYDELDEPGFLGTFSGTFGWPWGLGFVYAGVPTPGAVPSYVITSENGDAIINDILAERSGEVFVNLAAPHPWYWGETAQETYIWHYGQLVIDDGALDGRALFFSREDLPNTAVVGGPFATLSPGDYDITYRLKVSDNTESVPVAVLNICTGEDCQHEIAVHAVSPDDFEQAGQFQDITFSFSLERFTREIQFRIDFAGQPGLTDPNWAYVDLYADYIHVTPQQDLDLPVFAAVFISLMTGQKLSDIPQFCEDFELAGGITLSPDEFMAALNPEYMIGLASQIMGAGHPSISTAKQQLSSGDYLESLLTTRDALRDYLDNS